MACMKLNLGEKMFFKRKLNWFVLSLCAFVRAFSAEGGREEDGRHFYRTQISTVSVDLANDLAGKSQSPLVAYFKEEVLPYLMHGPLEAHPSYDKLQKYLAREAYVKVRGDYLQSLTEEERTEKRDRLLAPHKVWQTFDGDAAEYKNYTLVSQPVFEDAPGATQTFEDLHHTLLAEAVNRHDGAARLLGEVPTNDSLLRHFITSEIFMAEDVLGERSEMWEVLEVSGLIQTSCKDYGDWSYGIKATVQEHLQDSPLYLTLGCGSTLWHAPEFDKLSEFPDFEGRVSHCVTCGDPHINELTVAYRDADHDPQITYSPSSHAKVEADMFDPRFWDALGGHKFLGIKEHSKVAFGDDEQGRTLLERIKNHLMDEGFLEILCGSEEEITRSRAGKLLAASFVLIGQERRAPGTLLLRYTLKG